MAIENDSTCLNEMRPADSAVAITDMEITHPVCDGMYIGVTADYDLYINGSWILFKNLPAGSYNPLKATGIRKTTGPAAPDAGDVNFLY